MRTPMGTKNHKKRLACCCFAVLLFYSATTKCSYDSDFTYPDFILFENAMNRISREEESDKFNALLTKLQFPANKRTDEEYQTLVTMPNRKAMEAIFKEVSLEKPCRGSKRLCYWSREGSLSFWLNEKTISFGELLGTLDRAMRDYYRYLEEKGCIKRKKLRDRIKTDKKNIEKAVLALLHEPNKKISDMFLAKYLGVSNSPKNKAAMHQMQKNYGIPTPKRNSETTIEICKKIMDEEAVFLENACQKNKPRLCIRPTTKS